MYFFNNFITKNMQYNYYSNGNVFYREGIRSGSYVIDVVTSGVGWGGLENTDWKCIFKLT